MGLNLFRLETKGGSSSKRQGVLLVSSMAEEELLSTKQLKIILETLNELGSRHPDLYYESTESVSHLIHDFFKTELNSHKKELVKGLSPEDIYIKLSLKNKR